MIVLLAPYLVSFHRVFNVLHYITFRAAMATLTAMVITFALGPWFIRQIARFQFGQVVRSEGPQSHLKKAGTPTMGGILIVVATFVTALLWCDPGNPYVPLLVGGIVAFSLIGLLDDILKLKGRNSKGLAGRWKLILQAIIAAGLWWALSLMASPGLNILHLPFFKEWNLNLGLFSLPFFFLVLVGTSNAVNLTDGLDGLAIGCTLIAVGTYTILAYIAGHIVVARYLQVSYIPGSGELSVICGALVGASLGFLWFNSHPAQIFMGDSGSLALGGAIGLVALITKQELVLVIAGGVFVAEALSVMLQVASFKLTGRRIFLMAPFHHHFEKRGWDESKIVVRFWILSIIFALLALSTLKLR